MPTADRMLTTLRQALLAVRATPGRAGHLVRLPPCEDVLVVGDLHGNVPNIQTILKRADLDNRPGRHLVLQELIHGPFRYPNGGDKSHQLVDLFAALKCQYPARVHYLPGNHELAQYSNRPVGKGSEEYNDLFRNGVKAAYGPAAGDVYRLYMDLFRACPLGIVTPNRVFLSHSLPSARYLPGFSADRFADEEYTELDVNPGGFVYTLVWGRDAEDETAAEFLRMVDADWLVTGHLPTEDGFLVPNDRQVVLDTAGSPAGYVLFPADRPITHETLVGGLATV